MHRADDAITTCIADDHPVFRKGLRTIIENDSRLRFLGEAGDGEAALRCVETLRPQVVVLDISMPILSGLDVAREISVRQLPVSVVLLTLYDDDTYFSAAMELGAGGYLLKDTAAEDIVRCILAVASGNSFISPVLGGRVMKRNSQPTGDAAVETWLMRLTAAERRILRMVGEYMSTDDIALALFISPKTVENHRTNIGRKLNVSGHNALLRFALEHRDLLKTV